MWWYIFKSDGKCGGTSSNLMGGDFFNENRCFYAYLHGGREDNFCSHDI